jgi:RNA polymerase sigma-70 factor, ECF subfamily
VDRLTRLLVEARDGDPRSLEQFITETQSQVVRICRYLGDPDTAEDLAQESYERAIASLHRYRADGPGLNWLLTIVRRTCADTTRHRVRRRRLTAAAISEAATSTAASSPERHSIEMDDLLARLDPDRRAAFVLTQISGLRYAEAAAVLGCPVGTIRSRVARSRMDLLEMLHPTATSPNITNHKRS